MPADGEIRNGKMYVDDLYGQGKGGWVDVGSSGDGDVAGPGGTDTGNTQVGNNVLIYDSNQGWVEVGTGDLRPGDIFWDPTGGFPVRYESTETIYGPDGPTQQVKYNTLSQWEYELLFPEGGPGSPGKSGTQQSYGSTKASQDQQEAAAAASREDEQAHDMALEAIRQENARRTALMQEAGALTREIAGLKQGARQMIGNLTGVDPVRQAVVQTGGVQRGNTPSQAFRSDLQTAVDTQLPEFGGSSSSADLEAANKSYKGYIEQGMPTQPNIGFAMGGSVDKSGIQFGNDKRAIMLGEGQMNGDEEIGIFDPAVGGITEVIPLAGGAAEGASFDTTGLRQSLGRVYGNLGFRGNAPTAQRGQYGFNYNLAGSTQGTEGTAGIARRLGYRPRLIRNSNSGEQYFRNEQGILQKIPSQQMFDQAGFRQEDFLNVDQSELGSFGTIGGFMQGLPGDIETQNLKRKYSTTAQPFLANTGKEEIALPAIAQLAPIWGRLLPAEKLNLASAYGVAGLGTPEQAMAALEDEIGFFTPKGTGGRVASFG